MSDTTITPEALARSRAKLTDVVLASRLLRALDAGHLPMHAGDYQALAQLVGVELRELTAADPATVRRWLAPEEQSLLESVLHERGQGPFDKPTRMAWHRCWDQIRKSRPRS